MGSDSNSIMDALKLLLQFDTSLFDIVTLSLEVSLSAIFVAVFFGVPLGALLATVSFPGRALINVLLTSLMGLPPVIVGLVLYLLLSNGGVLGPLQLLYTPKAMIIAQTVLVMPIVAALTRQTLEDLYEEYREQFEIFGLSISQRIRALIWEARFSLITTCLAGFGRAIAEVGAVIIVGGNINHFTRVMTTSIALETSKGNLAFALGLGIVLISIAFIVNALAMGIRHMAARSLYA